MSFPLDDKLDITVKDLYDELYLDYFFEKTKMAFPTIFSQNTEYQILIRLMAWAVARSYQQPRILRYLYNPDLVMDLLLPRLADTLSFKYPLEYPVERLRVIIKYIQKIRRCRGTFKSIKQLLRLLEVSEEEVLYMHFEDYSSVVIEEPIPGALLIHYNKIKDFDFANEMLKLVMPAGYSWRLESALDTPNETLVYRNRYELLNFKELFFSNGDSHWRDADTFVERVSILRLNQQI